MPVRLFSSQNQNGEPKDSSKHEPNGSQPEVQIELDPDYEAKRKLENQSSTYQFGNGASENYYDFSNKRFTITNYEDEKSEKISTV